jgi:DNA-binding transcriptional MerR regulator
MASNWKVGDLARRTGLSVRTLHFYEEIGLLRASARSEAGHRLYTSGDIARLQRIVSLRTLGLTLEEIGDLIDGRAREEVSAQAILRRHATHLRAQIQSAQALATRLEHLAERLDAEGAVDVEDLLHAIEETIMYESYYTPEQLAELEKRRQELGREGMERVQKEWADVIADARAAFLANKPIDDPEVVAIARRWKALIDAFTGGNPGIHQGMTRLWRENTDALAHKSGFDPELARFMGKAVERLG